MPQRPACPTLQAGTVETYLTESTILRAVSDALDLLRNARSPGFLFSGGSARCVFQVGALETLTALGIRPTMALGVSAGAWNAAGVSAGRSDKLRSYWKFFCRMPYFDLRNLMKEHSPFIWSRLHHRAFTRYIGAERLRSPDAVPTLIALTRLRDRAPVLFDLNHSEDPLRLLLGSNYLPPFYTHALTLDGERYGDGGFSDTLPYESLFERGCDAVVIMASKGESEGGLYRSTRDFEHEISEPYRDRVVVIRPRHRMPLRFVERRWEKLKPIADLGALRAREVLLGERHPATDLVAAGTALTVHYARLRRWTLARRRW